MIQLRKWVDGYLHKSIHTQSENDRGGRNKRKVYAHFPPPSGQVVPVWPEGLQIPHFLGRLGTEGLMTLLPSI